MWVNLNGQIIPEENASVSVNNRSFRFGDGFFETIRMVNGRIPLANYHFQRLFSTLSALQFTYPASFSNQYFLEQIQQLTQQNGHNQQVRIRITVFRGNGGLHDFQDMQANWLIQCWALEPLAQTIPSAGLRLGIYPGGIKAADQFANLKTNNFLLYTQAAIHAHQQGWNDALILNHRGSIADATIASFFLVKGNRIITPPLNDGPLAGVMRRYLLEQLPAIGFTVAEETIDPAALQNAETAFLSNAVFGIKWIEELAGTFLSAGPANQIYQQAILPLFS